ncbi:MAG: Na+ dependent nucleoside transporter [Flavobacteriales bacterium]|nr:Na+ dependent nucleoside transporter [Flavobacteriales bacterium]|tara:strand:+ start:910 stop:2205 length:1296 start_codon:yes stop_codon:yes gene_type:complete
MTNLETIIRGLIGIIALFSVCYVFSGSRKDINWKIVIKGLLIQMIFAILILKVPFVESIFQGISNVFLAILEFTKSGAIFLFGEKLVSDTSFGAIFAFQILPTIVFFSALTSLLFYLGILQKIVYFFAIIMKKTMNLSGAESLAASGNIFLGQTESPLLIKPYISKMTESELLCLMGGGMATIAGGVFIAFTAMLGEEFAPHLLAASVMSAPAAIVACKILIPETKKINEKMEISDKNTLGSNGFDAIALGTIQGVKLAVNVGAMILVFIAFIALMNELLNLIGDTSGLNKILIENNGNYTQLSLEMVFGYLFAPIAWLIGIPSQDILLAGQLLGEKTVANEFIAYNSLGGMMNMCSVIDENLYLLQEKTIVMATYFLCGFANFLSIGIQIGGIGAIAPERRTDLSKLGIKALIAGTIASLLTAVIVGILI